MERHLQYFNSRYETNKAVYVLLEALQLEYHAEFHDGHDKTRADGGLADDG